MKKVILILVILSIAVISTACINNFAVQELNNKAQVFMENGDYEAAINRLEASIDLDSTIFETHYNLGVAYIKAKKYDKAIKILSKAIEMKPDYVDTYYSLAVAQDAYAQEILEIEDKPATKPSDDTEEEVVENENPLLKMPLDERKSMALELYNSAISSYKTYIEKSNGAKDSEDIQRQIKTIEDEIKELGDNK